MHMVPVSFSQYSTGMIHNLQSFVSYGLLVIAKSLITQMLFDRQPQHGDLDPKKRSRAINGGYDKRSL